MLPFSSYVLVPKSTFSVYWEIFITMLCYVSTYTLPLQVAFYDQSIALWIINYLIDIIMLTNMYVGIGRAMCYKQLISLWSFTLIALLSMSIYFCCSFLRIHTAYYNDEGVLITNPLMCAKHYFKTNFIYDVIANLLPTDIFALASKGTYFVILRLYYIVLLLVYIVHNGVFFD